MEELQRKQLKEALVQVALLESKALSVGFAEMIAYLQKNEHLPALGTYEGLKGQFTFLGIVLETAARMQ